MTFVKGKPLDLEGEEMAWHSFLMTMQAWRGECLYTSCRRQLDDLDEPDTQVLSIVFPSYLIDFDSWCRLAQKVDPCYPKATILFVELGRLTVGRMMSGRWFMPSRAESFNIWRWRIVIWQFGHVIVPLMTSLWMNAELDANCNESQYFSLEIPIYPAIYPAILVFELATSGDLRRPQSAHYPLWWLSSDLIRLVKSFPTKVLGLNSKMQ